jgi:chromosomal replication initiator protein
LGARAPFRDDFSPRLGRNSADGADVVEHLAEIPFPGRIAAPQATKNAGNAAPRTLPAFVAGPENRLVAATLNRMMSGTSSRTNAPRMLVLFGPSGVGKTHLARGLVGHWETTQADGAHYTTAADFRRELAAALEADDVASFRARIRNYKLLAIDDIHRLPANEFLACELRNTFDAFEESGGTIIVTSSRPADSLGNLPPDVRSRLASGLQLQLAAPGKAARMRIIRHASAAFGRPLSDDTAHQLADSTHGAAPDVFGSLFKLWSTAAAQSPATAASAQLTTKQPAIPEIVAVVARCCKVSRKLLKSASRKQSIVFARSVAIYLARNLTDASYEQIGKTLGGRDHTTIMHSYQKIDRDRLQNATTQQTLDELSRILSCR